MLKSTSNKRLSAEPWAATMATTLSSTKMAGKLTSIVPSHGHGDKQTIDRGDHNLVRMKRTAGRKAIEKERKKEEKERRERKKRKKESKEARWECRKEMKKVNDRSNGKERRQEGNKEARWEGRKE